MAGETHIDKEINIIILGSSGSGKSTIGNRITGSEGFSINKSSLEMATSRRVTVIKKIHSMTYQLAVVEVNFSMYVKDLYSYTQSAFKDSEIHLVLFVIRKGRITFLDSQFQIEILRRFNINLLKPICALIITNCELEETRDNVITQFKRDNQSASNLFEKGIIPTGFPVITEYQQGNLSAIERIKANMKEDEKTLDRLIESLETPVLHKNLIRKTKSFVSRLDFSLGFRSEERPDSTN